ncbi:MAG: phage major capsid protein [Anaerolineae bacterium]|nr:phage major capsid protein [Anaerolineae bacterium]
MQQQIKQLYADANNLYQQAMGIMNETAGKELPAEKQQQVDTLLDQVEAKTQQAKRYERMAAAQSQFDEPATNIPFAQGNGDNGGAAGKMFSLAVSPEVKALAQVAGFDDGRIKATMLTLEQGDSYDADRAVKHSVATALYWRHGKDGLDAALAKLPSALRKMAPELKALATSPGAAGGYLVSEHQRGVFIEELEDLVAMRRIANVLPPIPGGSTVTPAEDSSLTDATWTSEIGTGNEDTVQPFGQRSLTPHPLAKRIKVSRTLLRAGTLLNVENYILQRMARKHMEPEEYAFINGNGAQQPLGLLAAPGIASTETAASNVLAANDIVNWAYSLDARYARNATILCNQAFLRKVRLLRSDSGAGAGTGDFLWQPGLQRGQPGIILDFGYELSTSYPTGLDSNDAYEDNALVATIGDFSFYWIADSLMLEIQRLEELYAETNQVGFIGRKETDGMPVKADAFRHLKIKA